MNSVTFYLQVIVLAVVCVVGVIVICRNVVPATAQTHMQ